MTPDELRELVQQDEDAWNAHDGARLASLMAADVEFRTPWALEPVRGREAFREIAERYLRGLPDFRIKNDPVAFGDKTVAVKWRVTGTHAGTLVVEVPLTGTRARRVSLPPTQRRIEMPGCSVLAVDAAGLIATIDEYWNQASILPQLGFTRLIEGAVRQALSGLRR
jgi:steroid delta-isomerase-like uncharacterized protein